MEDDVNGIGRGIIIAVISVLLTAIVTLALGGVNAVSREQAESLIKAEEAKHEAKIDIVIDRLTKIEVNQARLEEKVDAMKENRGK